MRFTLLLGCILSVSVLAGEGYRDTPGYKAYLKLPDSYKSPEAEAMYSNGFDAEQKVKALPSVNGGTVGELLDRKANIAVVEDMGWITSPFEGGFNIERMMILNGMTLVYRWSVDADGNISALNGKAIGITR